MLEVTVPSSLGCPGAPMWQRSPGGIWGSCLDRGSAAGSPRPPEHTRLRSTGCSPYVQSSQCSHGSHTTRPQTPYRKLEAHFGEAAGECPEQILQLGIQTGRSGPPGSSEGSHMGLGCGRGHVGPCGECEGCPLLQAGRVAWAEEHKLDFSFYLGSLPCEAAVCPWARDSGSLSCGISIWADSPGLRWRPGNPHMWEWSPLPDPRRENRPTKATAIN